MWSKSKLLFSDKLVGGEESVKSFMHYFFENFRE